LCLDCFLKAFFDPIDAPWLMVMYKYLW